MREEFHGISHGNGKYTYQQLYHWDSLTANVWLPSLSELVGIDPGHYDDQRGCYNAAMQGLNVTNDPHVMEQGGSQWAYPAQFNASGGGTVIWALAQKETFWVRSLDYAQSAAILAFSSASVVLYNQAVTRSYAVHPAVY